MTRRRFYVPQGLIREGIATLPSDQAHHLRDVLRIESGDVVEILDGAGTGYIGEVELRGTEVLVCGLKRVSLPESPVRFILAPALIKSSKFEWVLEKSTELGVDEIVPLKTRLSEIQIPEHKIEARLERWKRILLESSKQCRRFAAPDLRNPLSFSDFLAEPDFSGGDRILFYEKAAELWTPAGSPWNRIVICTGPEGGWDPGEVDLARKAGFRIAGLGPRILRAETAAVAALSIARHYVDLYADTSSRMQDKGKSNAVL
jgi:16S rRNA (uracil1498-N3)-methyltransferase